MLSTPAAPKLTEQARPCPRVGVMADDVGIRRLSAALGESYEIVARGQTIDRLLDSERAPFEVAVLAGGGELLARGGPVELLQSLRPSCSIVVAARSEERAMIRKALRCGVDGFVFQESADSALAPAVEAVRMGYLSVPRVIRSRTDWALFSTRERQVLQLVADGLTNSEIADRLYLSESTIKSHLSSGFRKLGVCSRAEAAAAVLDSESGLHTAPSRTGTAAHARELALACA